MEPAEDDNDDADDDDDDDDVAKSKRDLRAAFTLRVLVVTVNKSRKQTIATRDILQLLNNKKIRCWGCFWCCCSLIICELSIVYLFCVKGIKTIGQWKKKEKQSLPQWDLKEDKKNKKKNTMKNQIKIKSKVIVWELQGKAKA